jgi:hypothetical protein
MDDTDHMDKHGFFYFLMMKPKAPGWNTDITDLTDKHGFIR